MPASKSVHEKSSSHSRDSRQRRERQMQKQTLRRGTTTARCRGGMLSMYRLEQMALATILAHKPAPSPPGTRSAWQKRVYVQGSGRSQAHPPQQCFKHSLLVFWEFFTSPHKASGSSSCQWLFPTILWHFPHSSSISEQTEHITSMHQTLLHRSRDL